MEMGSRIGGGDRMGGMGVELSSFGLLKLTR